MDKTIKEKITRAKIKSILLSLSDKDFNEHFYEILDQLLYEYVIKE